MIEELLPYPRLYSITAVRRHYPQLRSRRGIVRRKTKSTQRWLQQKEDFAALRRSKRNREIYEFIRPTVWLLYLSRNDPRTPSRISTQATSPATTPPRLDRETRSSAATPEFAKRVARSTPIHRAETSSVNAVRIKDKTSLRLSN